jgi:two-component system, chemotaxis family, response regulator WspR
LAEKTRCAIEAMALPHPASEASAVITVSIGVASILPDKDSPISELLNMADAALYQAKRAGRNQVVCAR